jgi:glycine/D-amino acid oxidase-like deaminating enzyme
MVARAPRILIAAGLGTNPLARSVGLPNVVLPQRGQILVTERVAPNLLGSAVASAVRQTPEGTVLIGDTKEDVGMDDRSSPSAMATLARRALRLFPALGRVRVVRSWGGLRVLTPDGDPVYDESPTHPGIFVATTHSGVTLAPAHRGPMVRWILGEARPAEFQSFTASRFPASSFEESTP